MSALPDIHVRCLVVGGGPAGMMTGYLLARAGVDVVVLEKHADFNRDFRGDTIHPSTLELLHELGLLEEFLRLPHQELREIRGIFNGHAVPIADFSRLPTRCKFIAFMPQWDFLDFLSRRAMHFPTFALSMQHEIIDLLLENDQIMGVRVKSPAGEREMRADLIIGADGRHSITHTKGKLEIQEFGVPIDVLWMRISKREKDPLQSLGFFRHGKLLVLLDRGDYFQVGFVIPKGGIETGSTRSNSAACPPCIGTLCSSDLFWKIESRSWMIGQRSNCSPCRLIACENGIAKACFALVTAPTPCRPPVASASTSRCKTQSRPQIYWRRN